MREAKSRGGMPFSEKERRRYVTLLGKWLCSDEYAAAKVRTQYRQYLNSDWGFVRDGQ